MKDVTTNLFACKTRDGPLLRWLTAVGGKIIREGDRRARAQGWQVIPGHGGLSRRYRDPRFDNLVACTACNGSGCTPRGVTCTDCGGTGRIVLDRTAVPRPGRRQP